ncbi:TetR/AcrR family transcriptional regulator [Kutzneria viridogrisea]|uniref:AcrR family transcriptional regulator n=1 Tax=Kutzneria viridogrisea TaxID=47990 RepID=A0ABR6BER5_9PSEU|nr:AcrR family transcriptional regulator [Kutzneria viridogrisea]
MAEKRPGGRSAKVRAAVLRAMDELVRERGVGEVTLSDLAERSGVNRATLYRRWGSLDAVVTDMTMQRLNTDSPIPDTGSLRGDLSAWAAKAARDITSPEGVLFLRSVVIAMPERDGDRALREEFLRDRYENVERMLRRAADRGERPPTVDEVLERLLAPMYFRVLMDSRPLDEDYARHLVAKLLADVS